MAKIKSLLILASSGIFLLLAGCGDSGQSVAPARPASPPVDPYANSYGSTANIEFLDAVETNSTTDGNFDDLGFLDTDGETVRLESFLGEKNLVLVFTRGFSGAICPYCSTQTSRLISNYESFAERNAEIVVVYPLKEATDRTRLDEFLAATRRKLSSPDTPVPFPVLLDVELGAVNQLGIQHQLAKPATYILDAEGRVRFAYVGESLADRPSIKAMLEQLDKLNPVASAAEDESS